MHTQFLFTRGFVTGLLLLAYQIGAGQSLERKVYSSAGDHQLIGLTSYAYTFGEPFIGTDLSNIPSITMGFHQPVFTTILAVHHVELKGRWENARAVLDWTTDQLVAGSSFSIERSLDGHSFSWVGVVQTGANRSNLFSFVDQESRSLAGVPLLYRLTWKDKNGATLSTKTVDIQSNVSSDMSWTLYPNPTQGMAYLQISLPESAPVKLSISNALGQQVQAFSFVAYAGDQTHPLNLSDLPAATYLIQITTPTRTTNTRLILTH